jgi:hypothetical protein
VVSKGSVGIIVNDEIGHCFHTRKGLRQGDPLSPILFNLVADVLVILVSRAKNNGQFKALVPNLVDEGLSISQIADDTILFMKSDIEGASNLKPVLSKACLASKPISTSELFCFGSAKDPSKEFVKLFDYKEGYLPFRYLGIMVHFRKLLNKD